jgi:hypothetical protein
LRADQYGKKTPWWVIIGIWLGWTLLTLSFQQVIKLRVGELSRPDKVLGWTGNETAKNSQNDKPFLMKKFMNNQVSWDSEFYLAIAMDGYDSKQVRPVMG